MATKTVVCPECGAAVPYGRLSCAACGSLLASVGGSSRHVVERLVPDEPPLLIPDDEAGAAPDLAEAAAAPDLAEPEAEPKAAAVPDMLASAQPSSPGPFPAVAAMHADLATPAVATLPVAGTYLAPSAAIPTPVPEDTGSAAAAHPGRRGPRPGQASLFADLPLDAPGDLAGWLVVAGGAFASISFLLPWATQIVIGGTLGRGYFDRWGLANPSSIILLIASLSVLGLGVLPNRVPAWLRAGLAPLVLGGVLLGLVWAYLAGPFGPTVGVWTVALGAVLLIGGGIGTLRPWHNRRHDPDTPAV